MNEFDFDIPNFNKYNPRKDVTATTWFRASNTTFHDSKFARLSTTAKLLWFYFLAELSRNCGRKVHTSVSLVSRHSGYRAHKCKFAIAELERNQMLAVTWRDADVPNGTNERTRRTKRTNGSNDHLTNAEDQLKLESQPAQSADKLPTKSESKTAQTWQCYSTAYRKRYGSDPVRNQTTNSQMLNFVKRIGESEAPEVAAYFLMLNDPYYAKQGHSVGALLRDCEKIRTLCMTGKRTTNIDSKTAQFADQLSRLTKETQ